MICRGKWAIAFKLYIADELKCFRFIHQSASLEADSAYFPCTFLNASPLLHRCLYRSLH